MIAYCSSLGENQVNIKMNWTMEQREWIKVISEAEKNGKKPSRPSSHEYRKCRKLRTTKLPITKRKVRNRNPLKRDVYRIEEKGILAFSRKSFPSFADKRKTRKSFSKKSWKRSSHYSIKKKTWISFCIFAEQLAHDVNGHVNYLESLRINWSNSNIA